MAGEGGGGRRGVDARLISCPQADPEEPVAKLTFRYCTY